MQVNALSKKNGERNFLSKKMFITREKGVKTLEK